MKKLGSLLLQDGRALAFAEYGDPEGQPIFYCHGGVSSKSDIAFADKFCEERGIRIIAPDRPGIGDSDRLPAHDLLSWTDDSRALLEHLNVDKVAILGWSLGGPYALACAYKMPDLVTRVGAIGGAGSFDDPATIDQLGLFIDKVLLTCPEWMHGSLATILKLAAALPPQLVKSTLVSELASASDREIVSGLSLEDATTFIYESVKKGGLGVIDDYGAVGKPWGFTPSQIKVEVHLWHGDQDTLCPVGPAREIAAQIANCIFTVVPEAGHFLLHKYPEMVFSALIAEVSTV